MFGISLSFCFWGIQQSGVEGGYLYAFCLTDLWSIFIFIHCFIFMISFRFGFVFVFDKPHLVFIYFSASHTTHPH